MFPRVLVSLLNLKRLRRGEFEENGENLRWKQVPIGEENGRSVASCVYGCEADTRQTFRYCAVSSHWEEVAVFPVLTTGTDNGLLLRYDYDKLALAWPLSGTNFCGVSSSSPCSLHSKGAWLVGRMRLRPDCQCWHLLHCKLQFCKCCADQAPNTHRLKGRQM